MSSSSPIQIPVAGREERAINVTITDPSTIPPCSPPTRTPFCSRLAVNPRCDVDDLKRRRGCFANWAASARWFCGVGLGLGFLSAVADRFGLWGPFGQLNVGWGNFSRFLEYTHTLNWYLPAGMIPALGVIATGAESLFGLLLLIGCTHASPRC
jgi:hypothetical protein